jgi:hypothetical protein
MTRERRLGRVAVPLGLVVLSVLLVGSLWIVPYLPTNDGPEWVFATHIENHYGDPGTPYRDEYIPAPQFASRGFTTVYGPLEATLGWQHGLTAALSVVVLIVAWGFVGLVRAIDRRRTALGFLGFPLALSWTFYMGFWSFTMALGGGLLVLAMAARDRGNGPPSLWVRLALSGFLLVIAVAHIFAAVLTGAALMCLLVARAPAGSRMAEAAKGVVIGLPAAGIALASAFVARTVPLAEGMGWAPVRDIVATLPQTFWPGGMPRAILLTLGVAGAAILAGVRARRATTSDVDRGLGVAAVLLLLAAVFAPIQVPAWQFLSQRFITPGIALALAVLPLERLRPRLQAAASAGLFAVAIASVGLAYPFHQRLAASCADAIEGLKAPIQRHGEELPVALAVTEEPTDRPFRGEVPMQNPLLHMGALYAAVFGGLIPYVFASSAATHPFVSRPHDATVPVPDIAYYWSAIASDSFKTDRAYRHAIENELASFGMPYEGVLVVGARPDDVALWQERGYVADWTRGAAFFGHFEPCSIDFVAPVGATDRPTFAVGVGRFEWTPGEPVEPTSTEDGLTHFALKRTPCGEVWIRAEWPATASGASRGCSNALGDGKIHSVIHRRSNRVACTAVDERPRLPPAPG